ncbi:MAG: sulfotransferase [Pseudomonadales bacterium]|nr:hypothetical protein [Pseudomonadales bacterium]
MAIKVIGAGFGRTGTLSLKQALEKLGYAKCYHMMELDITRDEDLAWCALHRGEAVDFDHLFAGYQSSVDWPSCNFWREQLAHYPAAKVVLSERDPERWYTSVMSTIYPSSKAMRDVPDAAVQRRVKMVYEVIWDGVFGGRIEDRDHAIDVYLRHNQAVKDALPADRLLVFEAHQGWPPLCEFLGTAIPDEDFPRVNTTEDFQAMLRTRR